MSTQALKWAWDIPLPSPSAKLVLLSLAEHSDPAGASWPSVQRMAELTAQSPASVKRRLKEFEEMGLLARFERKRGDGSQASNEYRLNLSIKPGDIGVAANDSGRDDAADPPVQIEPPPVQIEHPGVHSSDRGRGSLVHPLNEPPLEKEPLKAPLPGDGPAIEAFAEAYPIPITRMNRAETLWHAMTSDERRAAIEGARGYRRLIEQYPKRAVADAHRWLGDQAWRGFIKPAKSAGAAQGERVFVEEGSDPWRAWVVYRKCFGKSIPICAGPNGRRGWTLPSEWPPFGRGIPDSEHAAPWTFVVRGSRQWWAWQERLRSCREDGCDKGSPVRPARHDEPPGTSGWRFPGEWPPAKGGQGPPPVADDVEHFIEAGRRTGTGT